MRTLFIHPNFPAQFRHVAAALGRDDRGTDAGERRIVDREFRRGNVAFIAAGQECPRAECVTSNSQRDRIIVARRIYPWFRSVRGIPDDRTA